jgi:hypothetical protein
MILTLAFLVAAPATVPASAATNTSLLPPRQPTLAEALETWVTLLEKDDAETAIRWAANDAAAKQITEHWALLKENHKKFDYRNWLKGIDGQPGALQSADANQFKIGGHSYGHLHVDWVKTGGSWQVANVWMCR